MPNNIFLDPKGKGEWIEAIRKNMLLESPEYAAGDVVRARIPAWVDGIVNQINCEAIVLGSVWGCFRPGIHPVTGSDDWATWCWVYEVQPLYLTRDELGIEEEAGELIVTPDQLELVENAPKTLLLV